MVLNAIISVNFMFVYSNFCRFYKNSLMGAGSFLGGEGGDGSVHRHLVCFKETVVVWGSSGC